MPNRTNEPGGPTEEQRAQNAQPAKQAGGAQQPLGVIGGTLTAPVPQHLSEDEPDLDAVGKASADSFPASDPPSQP